MNFLQAGFIYIYNRNALEFQCRIFGGRVDIGIMRLIKLSFASAISAAVGTRLGQIRNSYNTGLQAWATAIDHRGQAAKEQVANGSETQNKGINQIFQAFETLNSSADCCMQPTHHPARLGCVVLSLSVTPFENSGLSNKT